MSLLQYLDRHGIVPARDLHAAGFSRGQVARASQRGLIVRVRKGWYAAPSLDQKYQAAHRVGGRLTCVSAAEQLGLAVWRTSRLHVAVPPHASRLRQPRDSRARLREGTVVVHWTDRTGIPDGDAGGALDALATMAFCQPVERTVAAADSALRLGLITPASWQHRISTMPRRLRRLLARADGRSGSITESITRVRLQGLGIEPRLQVKFPGIGFVDFLIGERLVIEVDGRAYHSDPDDFENDRRRDARLSVLGYRVLRFSYRQVMDRWAEVRGAILAAIARGDHLR